MPVDRARIAALNNAHWCAAVWRANGLPVEEAGGTWICRRRTPPFYPNVVTVDAAVEGQGELIAEVAEAVGPGFSVKDSFARLELSALGLQCLFEASWLCLARRPAAGRADLAWRTVDDAAGLRSWLRALNGGAEAGVDLPAALLAEPGVRILEGRDRGGAIVAGGAVIGGAGVTGFSNVFGDRAAFVEALTQAGAGGMIVGYERGAALEESLALGFRSVGPLRVWAAP